MKIFANKSNVKAVSTSALEFSTNTHLSDLVPEHHGRGAQKFPRKKIF